MIPSPVRIQCQVTQRSSRDRTAESERPPRTNASFVPVKKIGYVPITPIAERVAMISQRRRVTVPDQPATRVATVAATPAAPNGSINWPMRCEWDANQAWKSLGERLFQKLTNATPITSIPPASKPRTRHASVINTEATSDGARESINSVLTVARSLIVRADELLGSPVRCACQELHSCRPEISRDPPSGRLDRSYRWCTGRPVSHPSMSA